MLSIKEMVDYLDYINEFYPKVHKNLDKNMQRFILRERGHIKRKMKKLLSLSHTEYKLLSSEPRKL